MFDIFISYRNDADGSMFGSELKTLLEEMNYSVYFNPDEQKTEYFSEEIQAAILGCRDFLLLLTSGCVERLMQDDPADWVRRELLMAHENGKHILPVCFDGVPIPKTAAEWPEKIHFLGEINHVTFPPNARRFKPSPISLLESKLYSLPEKGDQYRNDYNNNPRFDVAADYRANLEKARTGDPEALYALALNYYYGFADDSGGSQKDYAKAYECFKKLSETENPYRIFAINMIGHMYYNGNVPRKGQSYEESFKRHLLAAETIDSAAQHVAYMMSLGSGCTFDYARTVAYYESITERIDGTAKYNLAQFFIDYGDFARAAALLEDLYPSYPRAAIELGRLYRLGVLSDPPKPDCFRAAGLFQYAAAYKECGPEPYYELAKLYFNPTGSFHKNFRLAQDNFTIAADMGHVDSQYMLGYMYEAGHVERSIEKAIHYHELAAAQGHMMATASLAILYQQPGHVNYHRAFKYARTAAMFGMGLGEFYYANLLFFGRGCRADMDEAYKYYERSYRHGFAQAEYMMKKIDAITEGSAL